MKETRTYCDICREEIKQGYGLDKGRLILSGRPGKKNNITRETKLNDLCHGCTAKLFSLLAEFMEAEKK